MSALMGDFLGRPAYAATIQAATKANVASRTTHSIPAAPNPADMMRSRAWAKQFFSRSADLPISFVLDGKPLHGIPPAWRPEVSRQAIGNTRVETDFEGTDPKTGLHVRVECTEYKDFPVAEWVAWFSNEGRR